MNWPTGALKVPHMGKEEKRETNKSFVLNMKGSRKCDCWNSGRTAPKYATLVGLSCMQLENIKCKEIKEVSQVALLATHRARQGQAL